MDSGSLSPGVLHGSRTVQFGLRAVMHVQIPHLLFQRRGRGLREPDFSKGGESAV